MRKVNPLNDLVFKKVMGEEGSEVQLKAFLEAVLGREIKIVEIDGAVELTPDIIGNKLSRLDVLVKIVEGGAEVDVELCLSEVDSEVNVEVQLKNKKNMGKRSIFYWCRSFGNLLKAGKENDYKDLPNMITINLLDFEYIEDEPAEEFHNVYQVRNVRSGNLLDKCLEIHFIEMPKFLRLKNKDLNNNLHRWLSFFDSRLSEEKLEELVSMDRAIQEAQSKIDYISNDVSAYRQVMLREQALMDYKNDLSEAKQEGKQEIIKAMRASGMSEEVIKNILKLAEQNEKK